MISTNKTSTNKASNKKSGTGKNRKRTKSTSSEVLNEPRCESDNTEERYAVFKSDTIECFAEQVMYAEDLKLSPEFCSRLADDATYKLYELVHNIKTFAHPIGGVVTVDIVNDVIKLADVPPILGSSKPIYEDVGFDKDEEPHYFPKDNIITIVNELENSIHIEQSGSVGIKSDYFLLQNDTALIQTFYTKISRGLLSGSMKTLKDCLQILRTLEQFEPILSNLLILCLLVLRNYTQTLSNSKNYSEQIIKTNNLMYQRVLLILVALSNNQFIKTATVYDELSQIVKELGKILFIHDHLSSPKMQESFDDTCYKFRNENQDTNKYIKIDYGDNNFQTDIKIIDENNSSMITNVDDIIECKNIFSQDDDMVVLENDSNSFKCDLNIVEKLCEVLTALGENWLCVRGKIIELLLPKLSCDINDSKNMEFVRLISMVISKLLYQFDTKAHIQLNIWLLEVYGECVLFERPIQGTYLDMQI